MGCWLAPSICTRRRCLLVLDEVDRLPRETVEPIYRLVEHGPANLHFAMAFRANPGLDLAMQILEGSGIVVGADEFRFSTSEIEQFFQGKLSRRQLHRGRGAHGRLAGRAAGPSGRADQ